jgi:hypothetical protein
MKRGNTKMNNRQAIGYLLVACKEAELDKETIKKLRNAMYHLFDVKTEEEAEEQGHKFYNEEVDND